MKVWTYCLLRNEALMLPYFMRHYLTFSERVIIYDDCSDDGSAELAAGLGADVRPYPYRGLDDLQMMEFANRTYREARGQADWVIWVDADEFAYHPMILCVLGRYLAEGVTLPLTAGYAMVADAPPTGAGQIYDEIKRGVAYAPQNKPCIVAPHVDIEWGAGKHTLERGWENVRRSQAAEIKLLHYRHLGQAWFDGRNARNYSQISPRNIEHRLGWQVYPENYDRGGWPSQAAFMAGAEQVIP